MAWTEAERQRVTAIEEAINELYTVANNLASKQQIKQLHLIRQREVEALTNRIADLETQFQLIIAKLG